MEFNTANIVALLTAFGLGSLLTALVNRLIDVYIQDRAFKIEYHKTVLQKRIEAYNAVEDVLYHFSIATRDEYNNFCHIGLMDSEGYDNFLGDYLVLSKHQIWLSNEMDDATIRLNRLIFKRPRDVTIKVYATDNYIEIATIKDEIKRIYNKDVLDLYKIKSFLKQKKIRTVFQHLN